MEVAVATVSNNSPYINKARLADDTKRMLMCKSHIGGTTVDSRMAPYVFGKSPRGNYVINLQYTHEKLALAARIIVAVPNRADVCVVGSRACAARPALKFAAYTEATSASGRWTPGTLTNQITQKFMEPRGLIICDPFVDAQAIREAARANIPVIALCNTDSSLEFVDVAIPCNNRSAESLGLILWLLAREILYLRGELTRGDPWSVMPDMFIQKDITVQTAAEAERAAAEANGEFVDGEVLDDGTAMVPTDAATGATVPNWEGQAW